MKARDVIVIGTSAGGFTALKTLLRQLPPDLPASVFIVQHISDDAPPELIEQLKPDVRKAAERVRLIQQVLNHPAR